MRKTLVVLTAAALLAGACSKKTGGGVKLKTDTDSVAYVIGMNVGMNLMKMDSTINVDAVCEGIRDVFRDKTRLSVEQAETFYLSYLNYACPKRRGPTRSSSWPISPRRTVRMPAPLGCDLYGDRGGRSGTHSNLGPRQR